MLAKQVHLPKVSNFDGLVVAEQVLGLQVSVQIVVLVHVGQTLQGLEQDVADNLFGEEFAPFSHQLVDVQVQVLKHEVQSVLLEANLVQLHYIRV